MVLSALLFSSGRFSPSRFSLDLGWTTPSLSQPNSNVSGSNWKLSDGAAMSDATIDAIVAATLDAATRPAFSCCFLSPLGRGTRPLPCRLWLLVVCLTLKPGLKLEPRLIFEGKVHVPLVNAELEERGAMAPVLLVFHAAESDLKGHVSIAFLPVLLESAPVLPFFGRFEGWMLEFLRGNVQATAVSLLHWKSGLGIVDHFKTLVPGLHASSVPVWKGMPKVKEDQRSTVSLVSRSGVLQVSSFGIPAGSLLALCEREFWKERYWSIIYNDVRDAVVESPENLFEAAAALGTCRSQPEKLEAVQSGQNIQFFIKGVRGTETQVVRGGCHVVLGLVAGVMGMDVYAMVGGRIVNHSLYLESLGITSNCTVSFLSRHRGGSRDNVPGQWTCSNCLTERCWPVRTKCYRCGAPRHADSAPWNDKIGKGPKGPLGRAPPKGPSSVPPTSSNRPHVMLPRGGPPGAGVGDPPLPIPPDAIKSTEDMVKALKLLQNVMTKEDFSKYEKMVMLPSSEERGKEKTQGRGALASMPKGRKFEKASSGAS